MTMGLAMTLLLLLPSPTSTFAWGVALLRRTAAIAAAARKSGRAATFSSAIAPSLPFGGGLVRVDLALAAGGGEPGSKRKRKRRRRPTAPSSAAEPSPVGAVSPDPIKLEQERLEGLEPQGVDDEDDEEEDDDSVKEELLLLRDVAKFEFKPDSDALIGAYPSVAAQKRVAGRSIL